MLSRFSKRVFTASAISEQPVAQSTPQPDSFASSGSANTSGLATREHLSVSRANRGLRPRVGVRVHTFERPLTSSEIREVEGIDATTLERTLVDALEDGAQPEQIELGIRQAVDEGLTTPRRLRDAAADRSAQIRAAIEDALARVPA